MLPGKGNAAINGVEDLTANLLAADGFEGLGNLQDLP
jgi:hypothetical protein